MQGDDPPYLSVGTAVSAKYKGAFCEAKVSKVVRIVKCKVTYKLGLGTATVNDEQIKGALRVGQLVQAKHSDRKDFVEATITKIQDCSQYTVVFDDGDITTLRRTALCLKSGRHFNESETLDQLPLTHPEHFGNPVMGGRRGRRSRQFKEDSSEGEVEEENEPDLELYSADTGKVVSVEASDKKRNKDNWFPGLIVMPSAQPTVRINVKDEFLVRSFKDGRYYTVPKKEVSEFKKDIGAHIESTTLAEAVEKALKFLDHDELPVHWERNSLFNLQSTFSDSDENMTDSSDDEPTEEKDHFVAQLYKFMDDSGTPLNRTPTVSNKDVDFYRLFRLVHKMGGYNRVTNQNKWKSITIRLKFTQNQSTYNQVKMVYKKCLLSYESFYRTLGCTMLNHTRNAKKNKGRALIRDKDRVTPVQSPRPEKEDEPDIKKEEEDKPKLKKTEKKVDTSVNQKKKEVIVECSENSSDATEQSELPSTSKEVTRPKRNESKIKEKKGKAISGDKVKALVEKFEEQSKKIEKDDDKIQQTRSKSQGPSRSKEVISPDRRVRDSKTPIRDSQVKIPKLPMKKQVVEDDKKRGRKRNPADDKMSNSDSSINETAVIVTTPTVNIGDKLKVYYGPTHESKVTYEAKVIDIDKDTNGQIGYLVHYTGWNTRYDEWITVNRIAENLSATTKAKRLKQNSMGGKSSNKQAAKRGRGMSITGRSTVPDAPRSTTPSSVTSSSSRTKSPATPVSKGSNRITRQGETSRRTRRTSAQTDISVHSESESEDRSESDTELSRTRSGNKSDEIPEPRTYRRKLTKTKGDKTKEDEDTEKEEEVERPKRARKHLKVAELKSLDDTDDETSNEPKGREFDLNQIRSELKGFGKTIKVASTDTSEKETVSSDESTTNLDIKESEVHTEEEELKEKVAEKSSSSDDIYEFKEPEPFEFESRKIEDKSKKRLTRLYEDLEKSPNKKKTPKSPIKTEAKEEEKKRFRKMPLKKVEDVVVFEENIEVKDETKSDDPFDKLVESPSFHIGKSTTLDKPVEKPVVVKVLNMEEPLSMFDELPESLEENSEDRIELSDNEEQQRFTFTHASPLFLNANFDKSPDHIIESACDSFIVKLDVKKKELGEEEDAIQASIQRVIEQTNLTDDSNDALLQNQSSLFESTPILDNKSPTNITINRIEPDDVIKEEITEEPKEKVLTLPKQITSVFQESDSSFLENLCATPQFSSKIEDLKDINIKTGTKIADTILQKFSKIKQDICNEVNENDIEVKNETKDEDQDEDQDIILEELSVKSEDILKIEEDNKSVSPTVDDEKTILMCDENLKPLEISKSECDFKKRLSKKIVSKEFIDDLDSDSDSDSEQRLVIARSDDDSQASTSLENKPILKEMYCSDAPVTEDSQEEDQRNFNFQTITNTEIQLQENEFKKNEKKMELIESVKEEEPDSHLHSMLLCEETIPGSPAPAPQNEPKPKSKNVPEMPFASAPSSSNSKSILHQDKVIKKELSPAPVMVSLDNGDTSTVLDNTPPTTPESTISNVSPRGEDIGGLSPSIGNNERCKSVEADNDFVSRRLVSNNIAVYSEDDSLMNTDSLLVTKKLRGDELPSPCKKRRRSCKGENDLVAPKRGRKSNRSRHNSDSDDTSEHSIHGMGSNIDARFTRSPRPSKYNFYVELDPNLDSAARIAVLQQKLQDLRKTYANVKAELVTIERRRKKIRRREREALKAAKQDLACT